MYKGPYYTSTAGFEAIPKKRKSISQVLQDEIRRVSCSDKASAAVDAFTEEPSVVTL